MKRRVLALVVLGAAVWLAAPQSASAFGGRNRGGCGSSGMSGNCGSSATSYTVSYVDKKVTAYKCETVTKDVKVVVNEWVDSKQDYKYIVCEPVTSKKKVTVQEMRTKEEAFKYTAMEWREVKEKARVCEWKLVTKDVECTTYDRVPVITKQKRIVCETVCVPVTVTKTVSAKPSCGGGLFARCRKKDCNDPCETPCPQTITCTVMKKQKVQREIEVDVCTYTCVPKKSIQKVTTKVPEWTEKEVVVKKCVPVEQTGKRTVCYYAPVEKEVTVTTNKMTEKTGTRVVKKCVPVEKTVKQTFSKMVPYETTVKVAVCTPCPAPAPCATPCATPCTSGTSGGGLFKRCCK